MSINPKFRNLTYICSKYNTIGMDSISQIVLGAACAEVVAGKKIGNKAMLLGALGGTIPDLDIAANFFTDEMTAMAFHRGFMHSLLFAVLFPWLIGWVVHRFSKNGTYFLYVQLFFWSIFTHPLLDCFTGYGTQLFQPFSDFRVQWDTVSVVDPIYTIPFGIFVLIASRFNRENTMRQWLTWAGIVWSCGYLAFTVYHKCKVKAIFESSLAAQNIAYTRLSVGPTIFNNVLWDGVAEGDTCFYMGLYGFKDKEEKVQTFIVVPKQHEMLAGIPADNRDLNILRWFSDGYYAVERRDDGKLQVNDLRFGMIGSGKESRKRFVFTFILEEKDGKMIARQFRDIKNTTNKKAFSDLWRRINGETL